jgi:hypothetical protein
MPQRKKRTGRLSMLRMSMLVTAPAMFAAAILHPRSR